MFSLATRIGLGASLLLCGLAGWWFRGKQNRTHGLGGKISTPKLVWLFFAVWFWLFECAVLAFEPSLPWAYRMILGAHAGSMWLRSAVELVMLYVTKNWRPPLGIAHDVVCVLTVLVLLWVFRASLLGQRWGPWAPALLGMLLFSLGVEILYATLFFRAVGGKTTGHQGVWFASGDEVRFRRINRLTALLNAPQLLFQVLLVSFGLR